MLEYRSLDRSCTLPVVWPSNLTVLTAIFIVQSDIYCLWRHEFFSVIISWNVYPKCISYRKSAFMMISSYDDLRDHSKLKHVVNVSGSLPGADKMNMCTGMFDDLQCCNILFLRCHLTVMFVCIQIGKAAFQRHNDPLDAALFYLAMKKKAVLWGLFRYLHYSWIELLSSLIEVFHITFMGCWDVCFFFSSLRSQHDEKMTQFFKNNFTEDRWRKAALKNAFSLLGKQRFEQSAAFFLLAGSLKDAIEVRNNTHTFTLSNTQDTQTWLINVESAPTLLWTHNGDLA